MEMGVILFFKSCTFLTLFSSFLLKCAVASSVYTVGDEEEWSSQTNYALWAEKYNFSLGDILVFKYVKGDHNVYEVREDTFRSCDASSGGVLAKYDSGEDEVLLNEVKKYWFICNIAGHCLGGMRFGIEVKNHGNYNVTPTASNSTDGALDPQIAPAPQDNSCTSYTSEGLRLIGNFIPFGLLFFNFNFL